MNQQILIKDKTIFILGLGISGISAAKALSKFGAKIYVFDDKVNNLDLGKQIIFCHYNKVNWQEVDYLLMSPGIPTTFPKPHAAVILAKNFSVKIVVDVELFINLVPKAKIIAVTGTNGKSTTVSLINHIFLSNNKRVGLGGNIGVPVFDLEINNNAEQYYILELSSYQLELMDDSAFDIAILLNITADHIDRHGSIENYIAAKKKMFKNSKPEQKFIISIDDDICKAIYKSHQDKALSLSNYNNKADIFFTEDIIQDTTPFGNKQNILAAITSAKLCNIDHHDIINSLNKFKSLPHRMEFLGEMNNVSFYNDSKATNAESSLNAIKQLKNIYWIAGGIAKEGGIELITNHLDKVKKVFLIGESQKYFAQQLDEVGFKSYQFFSDLESAVKQAFLSAKRTNQTPNNILFSPSAASFDMWKNFVERGEAFRKTYIELK